MRKILLVTILAAGGLVAAQANAMDEKPSAPPSSQCCSSSSGGSSGGSTGGSSGGSSGGYTGSSGGSPAAIPEPASMLLMGAGVAGLAFARRRARKAAK